MFLINQKRDKVINLSRIDDIQMNADSFPYTISITNGDKVEVVAEYSTAGDCQRHFNQIITHIGLSSIHYL